MEIAIIVDDVINRVPRFLQSQYVSNQQIMYSLIAGEAHDLTLKPLVRPQVESIIIHMKIACGLSNIDTFLCNFAKKYQIIVLIEYV